EAVELLRDPYVLVVPAAWELGAGGRPFRVRDLRGVPLVSNRTCHTVDAIESFLRRRGVQPDVVFRSDDNGTVQAAVAAGLGVALVPQLSLDPDGEGVGLIRWGGLRRRS